VEAQQKTTVDAIQDTCETMATKIEFKSSQAFHQRSGVRIREITTGEQFEPQILESFDPVTQELY
jgi:hypothetical protein